MGIAEQLARKEEKREKKRSRGNGKAKRHRKRKKIKEKWDQRIEGKKGQLYGEKG